MNQHDTQTNRNLSGQLPERSNDSLLGFLSEWIEDASIGEGTENGSNYIYRKLPQKLKLEPNNSKREIDVYFSSAEHKDVQDLLNYLLPTKKKVSG